MRLTPDAPLPAAVRRPAYDRGAQACGMVHLGLGAFHRAHQAVYADDAMNAGDRDWGIIGVSMRSGAVAAQLKPQDGLYSCTERSGGGEAVRLIGAVHRVLVAPAEPQAVIAALAAPGTHLVTLTITEKGYQPGADGGDPALCALLAPALAARRAAGLAGLTLVSCDNLAENGRRLAQLVAASLARRDPSLALWFDQACACPSTMVDRIVPAPTPADLDAVAARLGLRDEAAVVTEPFRQWVIEDRFAGPRPRWEAGGAQIVADVRPYEAAKLRLLNGAHSALAYLGLARGHAFVHQAVADPLLAPLIDQLMRREAAASLTPAPGQDLEAYAEALIARFANPALNHHLAQIAMDGSQKIPQRWLETLSLRQAAGCACPAILEALAAWMLYVRGEGHVVDDPRAADLAALWKREGRGGMVAALFGAAGLFAAHWVADPANARRLQARLDHRLDHDGAILAWV